MIEIPVKLGPKSYNIFIENQLISLIPTILKKEVSKKLELADVVISTAQVLGGKSPILIPKTIVDKMKPGSVIIDLASASGGNCEITKDGKMIIYNDIKIVGNSYLTYELSQDSSNLFCVT